MIDASFVTKAARVPRARRASFSEVGYSGIRRYGGFINEEFLFDLRGKRGIKTYMEMSKNDPIIGASLRAFSQTIKRVNWFCGCT